MVDLKRINQTDKPIRINKLLKQNKGIKNLRFVIASAIHESDGSHMTGAGRPTKQTSALEGIELWGDIKFMDSEYILIGHKCFMTLVDEGEQYAVTSIYVHPKFRRKGYASAFMKKTFKLKKQISVDTWVEGIKKIVDTHPQMYDFRQNET